MQRKTDYHIHPDYSPDADRVKIIDYCHRALELNLEEICFTTHLEFGPPGSAQPDWLENYIAEIREAQENSGRRGLR